MRQATAHTSAHQRAVHCRYSALHEAHEELQGRWRERPPREEDVALIKQLKQANGELEELVGAGGLGVFAAA